MSNEQEERDGNAPESDELRMGAGHAVALPVNLSGTLLLDESLKSKIQCLARQLAKEHEGYFCFAREENEGCVDDAETLGEKGEVGAA